MTFVVGAASTRFMPMMMREFWVSPDFDPNKLRKELAEEIGARAARPGNVEISTSDGGRLQLSSMDIIALVYASKIAVRCGAISAKRWALPSWAETSWRRLAWFTRLRIRLGTIRA